MYIPPGSLCVWSTVENAVNKATTAAINEINSGVIANSLIRPWDTSGTYARLVRVYSSLTLPP